MSSEELLSFFKALSDGNRLKIVGLLANRPYAVEELAASLNLKPSTISHHLSRLADAGLVSARAEGHYSLYQLELGSLQQTARLLLSDETLPAIATDVDTGAYQRKVLQDFFLPDGRLKTIPSQRKKRSVILEHITGSFEPGVRYPESKVNEILVQFHEDTPTLRRELIGYGLMEREKGEYWRVPPPSGDSNR
jgi:hypothetical protein